MAGVLQGIRPCPLPEDLPRQSLHPLPPGPCPNQAHFLFPGVVCSAGGLVEGGFL